MKKALAIFLALMMLLSVALVSCNNDNSGTSGTTGDDDDDGLVAGSKNGDDDEGGDNGDNEGGENNNGENNGGNNGGNNTTSSWDTFAVAKTIYCMVDGLNIRTSANANADGNVLNKRLNAGESVTAIAKSTSGEGWYKITIDGQDAYVLAEYMTESEADTKFVALTTPETLTFKSGDNHLTHLRVYPAFGDRTDFIDLDATKINGTLVKVAVNESGNIWKVEYTVTGTTTPKTYYIGNRAFGNFVGYNESTGGIG